VSPFARIWAVARKDAAEESRRRIAAGAVFFFAATSLALCSFAVGPFGVPAPARPQVFAALLWILLFFSAATGLPRAFVREEEGGTGLALRRCVPAAIVLAGKTLFNYMLFLAIAGVTVPVFAVLMEWRPAAPVALALSVAAAGLGLAVTSKFLSALVARAGQRNVLFVVISFPLLMPLLLAAIAATLDSSRGEIPWGPLRVLVAYDGAAACAAYLLAEAAWED
jgi:heme exporter protein B